LVGATRLLLDLTYQLIFSTIYIPKYRRVIYTRPLFNYADYVGRITKVRARGPRLLPIARSIPSNSITIAYRGKGASSLPRNEGIGRSF